MALAALALIAVAVAVATAASRPALLQIVPAQALYEFHVPGDYLGGDGGMDSDYDDAIAPSEFFGTDEKGDAPFGDLRGFAPADRAPIYQGEYHEYEGGDWTEMKARPQMLAGGNNNAETGMAAPAPKKPLAHHPHHPGLKANAVTAAQLEAKLGKDASGEAWKKTPLRPAPQAAGFKAPHSETLAQTRLQAQAAAKDRAQVQAFQARVAREVSKLNQIDAMAEAVNFIDGPEGRKQGNQAKVGGMFDKAAAAGKMKVTKGTALHYVSTEAGAAQVAKMFDAMASGQHGANNGMLRARAHQRPAARPKSDPSLTPVQSPFATIHEGENY